MAESNIKKSGRPRSEKSQSAILQAAFLILQEQGYEAMAIEQVAARAGVGKATIYRWWENRQSLAVEAFFTGTQQTLAFPNTGTAREDFRQQIQQLGKVLRGPHGRAMATMISAARSDDILRKALFTRWIHPRQKWGIERINAAIKAGECVEGTITKIALEVMYSPIYNRLLFGLDLPSSGEIDQIYCTVARGIFKL